MTQEIVFYHSAMQGAPSSGLTSIANSMIAVLDACLVNGFNLSLVGSMTQALGVGQVTSYTPHGFNVGEWVQHAGANETAYNGRFKVASRVSATQYTFAIDSSAPSAATGGLTTSYPAAGFNKSVLGTNVTAYQGGSGSLGLWMQVEDNNPYTDGYASFRTRMASGLSALDTASVTLGTQCKITKGTGGWIIIADKKTVYIWMGVLNGGSMIGFSFGEIKPYYSADQFSMFQSLGDSATVSTIYSELWSATWGNLGGRYFPALKSASSNAASTPLCYHLRGISQVGSSVAAWPNTAALDVQTNSSGAFVAFGQLATTPSLADNSILVSPLLATEYSAPNYTVRGKYRGIYYPLGAMPTGSFTNNFLRLENSIIDGVSQPLLLVNIQYLNNPQTGYGRQIAYQIDGSWG